MFDCICIVQRIHSNGQSYFNSNTPDLFNINEIINNYMESSNIEISKKINTVRIIDW